MGATKKSVKIAGTDVDPMFTALEFQEPWGETDAHGDVANFLGDRLPEATYEFWEGEGGRSWNYVQWNPMIQVREPMCKWSLKLLRGPSDGSPGYVYAVIFYKPQRKGQQWQGFERRLFRPGNGCDATIMTEAELKQTLEDQEGYHRAPGAHPSAPVAPEDMHLVPDR